jgi:dCMP deaminase
MIIGITGTLGAGKGTVVEFLKERGFVHFSVREFLTEEISRRGLEVNRDNMIGVANDLRAKFGGSYIVEELYKRAAGKDGDVVIESVRCVGEVDALKRKEGFVLWAVDADVETRYARIVERGSSTDGVSFQEFVRQEESEMENVDLLKQNLRGCIDVADVVFRNDWTKSELRGKVEKELDRGVVEEFQIEGGYIRPTWDEYFMKLAALVGERSTCLRHNIGAVIVRDKRLIATGYNGSAKGMPNCVEVGCLKDELKIKTGTGHEICRAVHAEMNAIIQGASHGISVEGTTIYCTHTPCTLCARMIVNAGIKRVVSYHDYSDEGARKFLEKAGIVLDKVKRPTGYIKFVD